MEIPRRTVTVLAGCLFVPLSGCSSRSSDDIRIGYLAVENEHPDSQVVEVRLLADGESVYHRTVRADGFDSEANAVGGEILNDYPERPDQYAIRATRNGSDTTVNADLTALDNDCCQVIVKIRPDESLTILRSADCDGR